MAFTLHTEIAYAPRDGVAIEHEVFSYFDALHAASVPGGSALADFDEWTDRRYSSDDARALVSELEQARELISAAFARDIDTVPEPPERVGFDESEEGLRSGATAS